MLRLLSPAGELKEEIASSRSDLRSDKAAEARRVLPLLDELSQRVLRLRFGLDNEGERTLREVGKELGISYVTVWRREKQALAEMRRILEGRQALPGHHRSRLSRQEYQRRYRKGNHQLKEQIRTWWQDHPDYWRSWRLKNLERRRAYEREYKRCRRLQMSTKKQKSNIAIDLPHKNERCGERQRKQMFGFKTNKRR